MEFITYIVILALFFFLHWVFSGFETGIISLDRFNLEQEAKKNSLKKKILFFYDNPDKTLGTILIGTNIANVLIAAVTTVLFYEVINNAYASLITAFSILIFCEILPKNLFRDFPNTLVIVFFPLIQASYFILRPLVSIVTFINNQLKRVFKIDDNSSFRAFTKDDLAYIFDQTYNEGKLQQPQKEMLEDALEFNELIAKNVMIPRMDIVAIPDTMPYNEIVKIAKTEGYTRFPVYHENLDDITGVLIIYDLLKVKNKNATAKDLQREMLHVPESTDVDVLLRDMQTKKKSIAVVVDAYGGTSGIVTIEDIIEEIVGDIEDEYDVDEPSDVQKIDDNTWIVNAIVKVDELIDDYDMELPEGDYETVAGMIISHLARIPSRNQVVTLGNYRFEVMEVTNKRIKKVKIIKSEKLEVRN